MGIWISIFFFLSNISGTGCWWIFFYFPYWIPVNWIENFGCYFWKRNSHFTSHWFSIAIAHHCIRKKKKKNWNTKTCRKHFGGDEEGRQKRSEFWLRGHYRLPEILLSKVCRVDIDVQQLTWTHYGLERVDFYFLFIFFLFPHFRHIGSKRGSWYGTGYFWDLGGSRLTLDWSEIIVALSLILPFFFFLLPTISSHCSSTWGRSSYRIKSIYVYVQIGPGEGEMVSPSCNTDEMSSQLLRFPLLWATF